MCNKFQFAAGKKTRPKREDTVNWGVQVAGMIFQTHSKSLQWIFRPASKQNPER
ncbi:DUF6783 domain-containing protein [Anaerobutyricum hallii]|uniref:DUF6783 domain-containing protein n=1 Tax=Anaerobutyricum hallii TaxID=39488 RepID=UPI003A7F17C4